MSKHTSGEWEVTGKSGNGKCFLVEHEDGMIEVYGANKEANAHLIAAAPETAAERDELKEAKRELLEMLEAVIFIADNKMATRSEMNQAIANARAAIAKHSKGE